MPHITLMRKWILFIVLFLALTTMWILPQSQLFGPWRVQLVDAETQQPLDQAVVLIVFRKYYASVGGLAGGGYYNSAEGSTGVDGKVFIPSKRVFTVIPLLRTIQGPEVYIFKAGYGGWRFRGEEKWGESWQNGRMVVDMRKWIIPLSERSKFLDEMADRFERDGVVIVPQFNNEVQHLAVLKASALRYADYAKTL